MRRMRTQVDMEGKSRNVVCSRGSLGPALVLTGLAASAHRNSSGSLAMLAAIRRAASETHGLRHVR
jgi:hypothetical protein